VSLVICSDCNREIEFSILGSVIEKFVIPGSYFGIRLTEWSLFWYQWWTYFMYEDVVGRPYGRFCECRE